jgi:hypothetical protein
MRTVPRITSADSSAGKPHYRRVLAGRGGADVNVKGLVIAEHRRVWVWPATMVEKRASDVEQAAGQQQDPGYGAAGMDPHPWQREAACAAEPDEQRTSHKLRRARPRQAGGYRSER